MESTYYYKDWIVEFNDCYSNGRISYLALSRFLQDTAGYHADEAGYGLHHMTANKQSWVLTRFTMEFDKLPRLKDKITVRTWVRFVKGPFSDREYEILLNDKVIVRASSSWIVINFEKRIAENLALPSDMIEFNDREATLEGAAHKINLKKEDYEKVGETIVKFSALDMVQHVSNLKYLDWTIDNIDHEKILKSKLEKITVNYMKELKLGDEVNIYKSVGSFEKTIKMEKADGTACYAAHIKWKE